MKRIIPLSFLAAACAVTASVAAVPSLINYQGRLTDSSGDPVVGSKTFAVSIYDASTAGNLLYTESVGAVTLDNKGIYSFQFGSTGTSNTETSDNVATTDGTSTTYQKVVTNAPIVDGSLSISDGTYTWDQASGSSNESEFSVFYVGVTGQVTVIYSSAPAEGADITATYRHGVAGITGALSGGGEHWLELSVDGVAQSTRDRVLTVPFAARAGVADTVASIDESKLAISTSTLSNLLDEVAINSGLQSSSYVYEAFSVELGRNGLVVDDGNLFNWIGSSMTTRSPLYSGGKSAPYDEEFRINRYISGIMYSPKGRIATNLRFKYSDGSESAVIKPSTDYEIFHLISNPSPNKKVDVIHVWGGSQSVFAGSDFRVVRSNSDLYMDIQVAVSSDAVRSLRTLADGAVTGGGVLQNCLEWRIKYSDDSLSSPSALGESIAIDSNKTVSAVRLSVETANLGDEDLDISKVLVRKISK